MGFVFNRATWFEIWIKVGKDYIDLFKDFLMGNILFFFSIFSCFYLVVKERINNNTNKFTITILIFSNILSFFPLLNYPSYARYIFSIIPILLILTSGTILDISKKIVNSFFSSKKAKSIYYSILFSLIFLIFLFHFLSVLNYEYSEENQGLYDNGIIIPKKGKSYDSRILLDYIFESVSEKNISEVVVFPVNELMYEVITKLRSEKIETFDYFFCLTRPDLSNVFSECDIPINFSEVDLCPKGNVLVVDSNTYFTSSEKEMLENSFPERYFIAEKYIKDWKKCRESAVFLQTLSNVSIIDGKIMNISIYKID